MYVSVSQVARDGVFRASIKICKKSAAFIGGGGGDKNKRMLRKRCRTNRGVLQSVSEELIGMASRRQASYALAVWDIKDAIVRLSTLNICHDEVIMEGRN